MEEIWKDINGFEGCYQVSNLGRVKNLKRAILIDREKDWRDYYLKKPERILKPGISRGYECVVLSANGVTKSCKVHRLVAEHFIDNPENKPSVNHINGIKNDNIFSNLEWVTQKENIQHALKNKLIVRIRGEQNHSAKVTNKIAAKIREMANTKTGVNIARELGLGKSTVNRIINNKTWV